jgi:hypothetical protein
MQQMMKLSQQLAEGRGKKMKICLPVTKLSIDAGK